MANLQLFLLLSLGVLTLNLVFGAVNDIPLPSIDLDEWWGQGNATTVQDTGIYKYKVHFDEAMISDLKYRLQYHRGLTLPLDGIAFQYGTNTKALKFWIKYLAEQYPFKEREKFLNQYSHYTTIIQGLRIHFIRAQSKNVKNKKLTPLLIFHGWPGSVREFYEAIPHLLSIGESKGLALDIIVPSLPGFGFSEGATRPGLGADKIAIVFRNLMRRLKYKKYFIQAGDAGATIGIAITTLFPNDVLGFHTNFPFLHTPEIAMQLALGSLHPEEVAEPEFLSRMYPLSKFFSNTMVATGYMHIQATKPDSVGVGLADSPVGLMAYTFEKISAGLRYEFILYPDGGLTEILTADQILDNFMIYWSTNCMTTAMRIYAETLNKRYYGLRLLEIKTTVPLWVLQAPVDLFYIPGWLIKKKYPNMLGETTPSVGGHFYAWEQPQPYAEDVINAIVAFQTWHQLNSTLHTLCSSLIAN